MQLTFSFPPLFGINIAWKVAEMRRVYGIGEKLLCQPDM